MVVPVSGKIFSILVQNLLLRTVGSASRGHRETNVDLGNKGILCSTCLWDLEFKVAAKQKKKLCSKLQQLRHCEANVCGRNVGLQLLFGDQAGDTVQNDEVILPTISRNAPSGFKSCGLVLQDLLWQGQIKKGRAYGNFQSDPINGTPLRLDVISTCPRDPSDSHCEDIMSPYVTLKSRHQCLEFTRSTIISMASSAFLRIDSM